MTLSMIIAITAAAFLIVYFTFAWDRSQHWLLQLMASFFFIFMLLLLPKVIIDDQDTCDIVLLNQTTYHNDTTYVYGEHCESYTKQTSTSFYKLIIRFIYAFVLYVFLYFNYTIWFHKIIEKYTNFKPKKKQ